MTQKNFKHKDFESFTEWLISLSKSSFHAKSVKYFENLFLSEKGTGYTLRADKVGPGIIETEDVPFRDKVDIRTHSLDQMIYEDSQFHLKNTYKEFLNTYSPHSLAVELDRLRQDLSSAVERCINNDYYDEFPFTRKSIKKYHERLDAAYQSLSGVKQEVFNSSEPSNSELLPDPEELVDEFIDQSRTNEYSRSVILEAMNITKTYIEDNSIVDIYGHVNKIKKEILDALSDDEYQVSPSNNTVRRWVEFYAESAGRFSTND